jgi:hypothetical protein
MVGCSSTKTQPMVLFVFLDMILVDVNLLVQPNGTAPIMAQGTELRIHDESIAVGELRGFSGAGDEILYIGSTREANNIDFFAVHIITGAVRRLTSHPEYADPIAFSHDNQWFVTMTLGAQTARCGWPGSGTFLLSLILSR